MAPIEQRYAAMDDMAAHAENFGRTHMPLAHPAADLLPAHLATCMAPRRNLCAEFSAMPTDKLLAEAEAALVRLDRAGRQTDYAIVAALIRRLSSAKKLDGALWLDLQASGGA